MNRAISILGILVMSCGALVIAQNTDAKKVLADVRTALGGDDKLTAVKTITASGRSSRVSNGAAAPATDFELAADLPSKYMKKEVLGVMMGAEITRTSGFNDNALIEAIDTPPGMFGGGASGHVMVRPTGGGITPAGGATLTPEQEAENTHRKILSSKQDFARLTLGMFATSFSSYPLQFAYAGQAESPDGKADIIEIKGEGDFAAKLFIDGKTHLPLLLSWMAKAPISMNMGGAPTVIPGNAAAGSSRTFTSNGTSTATAVNPNTMSQADRDKAMADMEAKMKQAEADAKMVEYRMYYGDYQKVDGVSIPHHLQRSIDGDLIEDLTLEKIKINPKIDPKKFEIKKSSQQ